MVVGVVEDEATRG